MGIQSSRSEEVTLCTSKLILWVRVQRIHLSARPYEGHFLSAYSKPITF